MRLVARVPVPMINGDDMANVVQHVLQQCDSQPIADTPISKGEQAHLDHNLVYVSVQLDRR
eukprot:6000152-Pyramimonas_sp.AAC.1